MRASRFRGSRAKRPPQFRNGTRKRVTAHRSLRLSVGPRARGSRPTDGPPVRLRLAPAPGRRGTARQAARHTEALRRAPGLSARHGAGGGRSPAVAGPLTCASTAGPSARAGILGSHGAVARLGALPHRGRNLDLGDLAEVRRRHLEGPAGLVHGQGRGVPGHRLPLDPRSADRGVSAHRHHCRCARRPSLAGGRPARRPSGTLTDAPPSPGCRTGPRGPSLPICSTGPPRSTATRLLHRTPEFRDTPRHIHCHQAAPGSWGMPRCLAR